MTARRFTANEETIYRDLQATMRKIGASSLRVGQRDLLNPKDVAVEIIFDKAGRRYVVRCKKWPNWLDNLRAAQRTITFLYSALEEYGATTSTLTFDQAFSQLFSGFEATPDDTVLMLGSGKKSWQETLGVPEKPAKQEIVNAFRSLARIHHPDAGGDAETFKRLRTAYEQGLQAIGATA